MKTSKNLGILIIVLVAIASIISLYLTINKENNYKSFEIDLSNMTYTKEGKKEDLKKYTQIDFNSFLSDYESSKLPEVYVTEFLFDGAHMVKTYDLDDFIESGNDLEVDTLAITAVNINTTGDISFSGDLIGGMIAVNTNNIKGDINLILNGVNIDTDSKKAPAIYIYNKDITYTNHKVTIKTVEGTNNIIEGGKFKKVSLVPSEDLDSYLNSYSGDSKTWYEEYTNYYGVYTKDEIDNILFAKVQADNEDLQDGDPYYYYKGTGAISSDIDLYFEGKGYLEVTSKNKEGIETKGNLTFSGGTGDYVIYAQDDCLNTTTDSSENSNARNTLTIDVNSLTAIVDLEADEGDAIDSNGELIINGGTIIALAHPGQDAGLDSSKGTYINGGVVVATGDMYDEISSESKQRFIGLSFGQNITDGSLVTLLDSSDNVIFSYVTDRTYTSLVYSSSNLKEETYYLYKDGEVIDGTSTNGLYTKASKYTKGTMLGYSYSGMFGNQIGNPGNDMIPTENSNMQNMTPTEDNTMDRKTTPPEKPDGADNMAPPSGEIPNEGNMQGVENFGNTTASNKEFTISGISNLFSGIATYVEE